MMRLTLGINTLATLSAGASVALVDTFALGSLMLAFGAGIALAVSSQWSIISVTAEQPDGNSR